MTQSETSTPEPAVPAVKVLVPPARGLARERLHDRLARLWDHRLGLVVAPAGSGKTTLLAQFARSAQVPVAWYRADGSDRSGDALMAHLRRTFGPDPVDGRWSELEQAVDGLEQWPGERGLVVVDDIHALEGTDAERALARLLDYLPPAFVILAAGRRPPAFNLSRLRVSGGLLELDADDLRFRSWEVEQLFLDVFGEPLPPEDLAELARRTEGWAAGLALFHLATTGKPTHERRRVLAALGTRWRTVREYLTQNVLDELSPELRAFLLETAVLGRLTGALCDRLTGGSGSAQLLEEIERRQIFTHALDDGSYRYHEVLRSHLEAALVDQVGETEVARRYRRAGAILQADGALTDALRAYARAGDGQAITALLRALGEQAVDGPAVWLDGLPPAVRHHDPWLILATARRDLASGRLQAAHDAYQEAEAAFGAAGAREICRRERFSLNPWLEPIEVPASHWTGLVRAATRRDPLAVQQEAARLPEPQRSLVAGLAAMLGGHPRTARALLAQAAEHPDAAAPLATGARAAAALAGAWMVGGADPGEVEAVALEAERIGVPWLARAARALLALSDRDNGGLEAAAAGKACDREADGWGGALAVFLEGLGSLLRGGCPVHSLEGAEDRFRRLGAGVLEAWAQALAAVALAREGNRTAREAARRAESSARSSGVPGAQAVAYVALSLCEDEQRLEDLALARSLASRCGLEIGALIEPESAPAFGSGDAEVEQEVDLTEPAVALRCFGSFELRLGGRLVDLSTVKPRARAVLRLLALHAGRPVHRDVLIDALWPEAEAEAGTRNLQVAISSLRHLLEPGVARGASSLLLREGDAYRLALPVGAEVDRWAFERALADGRSGRERGDAGRAITAFRRALDLHCGELLPEDGPVEWVVKDREQCRFGAAEAALALADVLAEQGDAAGAAQACERGLQADRYRDSLWRALFAAHERSGDQAAATRARRAYDEVLVELGVTSAPV